MNFVDLLENYLILKERDKDLYYDAKDNIDKYKSFIYDNLAYDIIIKDDFIKRCNNKPGYVYSTTVPWDIVSRGHDIGLDEYL